MPTTLDLLVAGSTLPAGQGYTTEEHLENLGALQTVLTIVNELEIEVPDGPIEIDVGDPSVEIEADATAVEIVADENELEVEGGEVALEI